MSKTTIAPNLFACDGRISLETDVIVNGKKTINNYWMRLSMTSGIIQTEVNVICRSEAKADNIDRGLNNSCVMRKPNPIIVLLYI
jgi:hypothetical protein